MGFAEMGERKLLGDIVSSLSGQIEIIRCCKGVSGHVMRLLRQSDPRVMEQADEDMFNDDHASHRQYI